MRILICVIILSGYFTQVYCQVNDTVPDIYSDCIGEAKTFETQNSIKYMYWDNTISIRGLIPAYCCGYHYLKREIRNDSIFLSSVNSDTCKCICDFSFATELSGCSLEKYSLFINNNYIQEIRRYDSLSYITSSCTKGDDTDYNFKFSGDTLIFWGIIRANCGGTHFLLWDINMDTINLSRLDTGELMDCTCLYKFEAKFINCDKASYRVLLDPAFDMGLDTIVSRSTSIIESQYTDIDFVYPNPSNGLVYMNLNSFLTNEVQIKIFDISGKLVHSRSYMLRKKNIEMDVSFLQTGIYIMNITVKNRSKTLKLIKN